MLIATGLVLLVVEVYFIPGFNAAGIFGIVFIVFGIGYAFAETGAGGGVIALVGSLVGGGATFYALYKTGAWNRFVLSTTLGEDVEAAETEREHRAGYLGKSGVAITPLRPTGVIMVDGERVEVMTEGEFIASGSHVRVVAINSRHFFVRLDREADGASVSAQGDHGPADTGM